MINFIAKTDDEYEFIQGNENINNVCPFCRSCAEGIAKDSNDNYFVVCDNPHCRATGPKCKSIDEAIKFWNGGFNQ